MHYASGSEPDLIAIAYMTEALDLRPGERVLEIGTGSGYQAAMLAGVGASIWTIERNAVLAARARRLFEELEMVGVQMRVGDGYDGWREQAPFDGILVTKERVDFRTFPASFS